MKADLPGAVVDGDYMETFTVRKCKNPDKGECDNRKQWVFESDDGTKVTIPACCPLQEHCIYERENK